MGDRAPAEPADRRPIVLFVMLAAAAPVGAGLVSLVGDDQFLPRNLATSAPGLMLAIGALLAAGTVATRIVSTGLVVAVFAVGAVRTTESQNQRIDYAAVAAFIDRTAGPEDIVLDIIGTGVGGTNGVPLARPRTRSPGHSRSPTR